MTPQLQQAIKLLQLSNVELAQFIEEELERNPLLERDERDEASGEPRDVESAPRDESEHEVSLAGDGNDGDAAAAMDADYEALHPEDSASDAAAAPEAAPLADWSRTGSGSVEDPSGLEDSLAREKSLTDHLEEQLLMASHTPAQRLIAAALFDATDDSGYLRADLQEVADRLGCALADVEQTLALCQTFEPTGIMARSLAECLTLQLKERDRFDPAMQRLVAHLDLLARADFQKLETLCGVDGDDLMDMIGEIRSLSPRPGAAFGASDAQTVIPDVFVREAQGGGWLVELNTETLPRVLVNQRYFAQVHAAARREDEKTFITECAQNANWLIKSLDQRARTILKVAREIVRQQDGFLAFGVRHLRPLNLKTIADAIDMHESTVSRVTSNKFIATPRGVFELKYFFTAAIAATDGAEAHSAEAVRDRIKALIDNENPLDTLSDDKIVEFLHEAGVEIARRTVAKYREVLRIPSSVQRRRLALRAG
jgi:RNA polymerase sigma-54 factor